MTDVMREMSQLGTTFYGSHLGHLTSCPLWITHDSLATIICPYSNFYNFAWGRSGGSSEAANKRKHANITKENK